MIGSLKRLKALTRPPDHLKLRPALFKGNHILCWSFMKIGKHRPQTPAAEFTKIFRSLHVALCCIYIHIYIQYIHIRIDVFQALRRSMQCRGRQLVLTSSPAPLPAFTSQAKQSKSSRYMHKLIQTESKLFHSFFVSRQNKSVAKTCLQHVGEPPSSHVPWWKVQPTSPVALF